MSREQWLQRASSRWGRLVLWFAAFALMGVVEALQMRAGQRLEDFTITWATALRRGFEMWIPSGVLGLGVVWLARRFPFDRERWLRWAGLHLVLSLAYVVVFAVVHAGLLHGQRSVRGPILEFDTLVRKVVVFYSVTNIGFYWLLLVAHEGWVYYQRYRERERRTSELESQLARARLQDQQSRRQLQSQELQVATQIQEITLSYVPKLLAAALVLLVLGGWMLGKLNQFAISLYNTIPSLGG